MKKILSIVLCLCVAIILLTGISYVSADEITVELDGKKIEFDVKPEIIDGRTMVPLRKIFEEIGATVKWDNDTKTVSARKNSKTVTLVIDSTDLEIDKGKTDDNGNAVTETVTLEVPAQVVSGRTLVPARAIAESFDLSVDWEEENQKVVITSDDDEDDSWKSNVGSINLTNTTYEGEGIKIEGNQIKITDGGDYTLSGTLADGNITVSTDEKVKLRLSGAEITSSENPCIYVEDADKVYITLTEGTENSLIAENSEDGAIYSKDNLEIKGKGKLNIESEKGHGIKTSDNLNIENGTINIIADADGMHINDTFKMTGGTIDITAIGDGIDCESIVNIEGGAVNIETNGIPLATSATDAEFEKSTKGINAEWFRSISGGEININSASHAIHCEDEIEINGGKITISSEYDKGISAHGNLTVNGTDTVIDIAKSTEGIESKNVMTINDGVIKVVASDDALNATGGNSGAKMQVGNFGGNREMPGGFAEGRMTENGGRMTPPEMSQNGERMTPPEMSQNGGRMTPPEMPQNGERMTPPDMPQNGGFTMPEGFAGGRGNTKTCLIINGGDLELCAVNDCLDANGSLEINGGTIKATDSNGSFSGAFAIVDPDGQASISENANLIFAAGSVSGQSLGLTQNNITVYCESTHTAGDKITVSDSKGNTVYEYTPNGSYRAFLIASQNIKTGETYTVTIGSESF
ncbi:MAG: carbohydrate-binding domain-containing protein, partial [Clostridia bacterium]|nr:carbohydrate-binding domain-containing protein [Clostridia bacterium]